MRLLAVFLIPALIGGGAYYFTLKRKNAPVSDSGKNNAPSVVALAPPIMAPKTKGDSVGGMISLQADSLGKWLVAREAGSLQLSGAAWVSHSHELAGAGREFLDRYGSSLLGANSSGFRQKEAYDDGGSHHLVYAQMVDGVQVYNSRINLVFDDKMNLIYFSGQYYDGPVHSAVPMVQSDAAALVALGVVRGRVLAAGGDADAYTEGQLKILAQYYVYLSGGRAFNVYRFVVPLAAPLSGELEVFVDATTGAVSSVKNLARH